MAEVYRRDRRAQRRDVAAADPLRHRAAAS
jgi:hypothetical protein